MGIFNNLLASNDYSNLSNPKEWFKSAFGGGMETASGVTVTEENAMSSTAVYAAQKVISETMASLPLFTYKRLEGAGKEKAHDHYLYTLLHDQPNEEMTSFTFRELMQHHILTWGNAYAEIEWTYGGEIRALWPLNPAMTTVARNPSTKKLEYTTTTPDGETYVLKSHQVFHIPGLGNGIVGKSPIRMHREAIGLGKATEEFGARFFGNGATPSGIVEYPGKLDDQAYDRFRKDVRESHTGLSKSHKLMILEEGLKYHQVGIPPEDAQFLETRKFQISEIARIYRVPPHKIADLERSTNNNIEHQSIEFVVDTITPWSVRWEQAIKMQLLTEKQRKVFFAEFMIDGLLRGDYKSRQEGLAIQRQNGVINADEWRSMENNNPIPTGEGQAYLVNGAMVGINRALEGGENNKKD